MSKDETRQKLVVRYIPPCLSEEEFRESVERWAPQILWLSFQRGKFDPERKTQTQPGCAHVKFESPAAALEFSEAVDGAAYRDAEHHESRLAVEWALSQRVPAEPRPDRRAGTIENDESYLAFLGALEAEKTGACGAAESSRDATSANIRSEGVMVTPLMAYIRDKENRKYQRSAAAAAKKAEVAEKRKLDERQRLQSELLTRKENLRLEQEERTRRSKAAREEKRAAATKATAPTRGSRGGGRKTADESARVGKVSLLVRVDPESRGDDFGSEQRGGSRGGGAAASAAGASAAGGGGGKRASSAVASSGGGGGVRGGGGARSGRVGGGGAGGGGGGGGGGGDGGRAEGGGGSSREQRAGSALSGRAASGGGGGRGPAAATREPAANPSPAEPAPSRRAPRAERAIYRPGKGRGRAGRGDDEPGQVGEASV